MAEAVFRLDPDLGACRRGRALLRLLLLQQSRTVKSVHPVRRLPEPLHGKKQLFTKLCYVNTFSG